MMPLLSSLRFSFYVVFTLEPVNLSSDFLY